jgi:hypothetical protein
VGIAWLARSRHPRLYTWMLKMGAMLGFILLYLLVRESAWLALLLGTLATMCSSPPPRWALKSGLF